MFKWLRNIFRPEVTQQVQVVDSNSVGIQSAGSINISQKIEMTSVQQSASVKNVQSKSRANRAAPAKKTRIASVSEDTTSRRRSSDTDDYSTSLLNPLNPISPVYSSYDSSPSYSSSSDSCSSSSSSSYDSSSSYSSCDSSSSYDSGSSSCGGCD